MNTKRLRAHGWHWIAGGVLWSSACTYGVVTDAATGHYVGGAQLTFQAVVPASSVPANHLQPQVTLGDSFVVRTWSADDPGSSGAQGVYYLNPAAADGDTDPAERAVPGGWTAMTVSRSGYDTRRFYRNHLYTPCTVSTENPYSGGAYPIVPAGDGIDGYCAQEDFKLQPSGTNYDKPPDMIVDPRSLLDYRRSSCRFGTCLRTFVSTANVGAGDLFVEAAVRPFVPGTAGLIEPVTQVITHADGSVTRVPITAVFEYDDSSKIHAFGPGKQGLVRLRLRRYDPAICGTEALAASCPVASERQFGRVADCLYDESVFDASYTPLRNIFTGCTQLNVVNENGIAFFAEGVSPGRAFFDLWGTDIDIGGLASGDYWLEAEVNPEHVVVESDYANNIARVLIQL